MFNSVFRKKEDETIEQVEKRIKEKIKNEKQKDNQSKELSLKNTKDKTVNLDEIFEKIIQKFIVEKPSIINNVERGKMKEEELKKEIFVYINRVIVLSEEEKQELFDRFKTYIWGYGKLQSLIDDPDISDIKTIAYNNIRIKVNGQRRKADIEYSSNEELEQYINYVAIKNGITLSEMNAIQKITDTESSDKFILRINICSSFINSVEHSYLVIRKIPKEKYSLEDLKRKGVCNDEIEDYLITAMKAGLTIFTTGKGASGKTTILNALIDYIPTSKSGLIIQEAEELFSKKHPDLMFQKVKLAKGESKIEYTLRDLAINGLLTDIDVFGIGEIKGGEALDMVNAIYTGATGLSSTHANSAREMADKLVHYMKYVSDMPDQELMKMLASIDVIIFMKDFRVNEIVEVVGYDDKEKTLIYKTIFKYEFDDNYKGSFIRKSDSCDKIKAKIAYQEFIENGGENI